MDEKAEFIEELYSTISEIRTRFTKNPNDPWVEYALARVAATITRHVITN